MENIFVKNFLIYLLLTFSVILTGCVSINHGEFGSVSVKDYTPSNDHVLKKKHARGEAKTIYWALYPGKPLKLVDAVDDAIAKYDGLFMKNVSIRYEGWIIPLIWGEFRLVAEGEVWGEGSD